MRSGLPSSASFAAALLKETPCSGVERDCTPSSSEDPTVSSGLVAMLRCLKQAREHSLSGLWLSEA